METTLSLETLPLPKEKTYFTTSVVISAILWLLILVSCVGIIYVLLGALIAWIANGLLIARIKSESVKIDEQQYPELCSTFREMCLRLNITTHPGLYILQAGGVLNAFATRHSGRNFVVINSSFLEATGPSSPQIKFLIGHEIGHIQRNHLLKHLLLLPSSIIPLLGEAYSRACEATCDRFGAFAANDLDGATRGLLILAAGREAAVHLDASRFAIQHFEERGFFISWHELNSRYPTLSQRVSNLIGLHYPEYARTTKRSEGAYICAFLFNWRMLVALYIIFVILIALGTPVPHVPHVPLTPGQ
jgi:Zn-dependent protease with chaperone function